MLGAVIIILQVLMTSICDIIAVIIKEDIPYLELTYLLQLLVQTLSDTAIYHMKNHTQHEMAPDVKTCCSKLNFNLESLFQFVISRRRKQFLFYL